MIARRLYVLLGGVSLALAVAGIFLPLLPTTPFLLLTASLWFKSSPRLYERLLSHKILGPYIRNFRQYRAIPLRAKIVSVALVWVTLVLCAVRWREYPWIVVCFIALAAGISYHILSYRTLK